MQIHPYLNFHPDRPDPAYWFLNAYFSKTINAWKLKLYRHIIIANKFWLLGFGSDTASLGRDDPMKKDIFEQCFAYISKTQIFVQL